MADLHGHPGPALSRLRQVHLRLPGGALQPDALAAAHGAPRSWPRRLANGDREALWSCLTCMYCDSGCPQEVTIIRLMPRVRTEARQAGEKPPSTRCGAMESVADHPVPGRRFRRTASTGCRTTCALDPREQDPVLGGLRALLRRLLRRERVSRPPTPSSTPSASSTPWTSRPPCAPTNAAAATTPLWGGDEATFERLAEMNVKMFGEAAARSGVTVCPECSLTLDPRVPRALRRAASARSSTSAR